MRPAGRTIRELIGNTAVAFQAKLSHLRALEHFRIARAVGHMTRRAAFDLQRSVLKNERTLFIRVAFDTSRVNADRELRLFLFKTSVRIMTIAAFHCSFQHFMMKRFGKLRLRFAVAADAELLLVGFQHGDGRILTRRPAEKGDRIGFRQFMLCSVSGVAIGAADIVAPMIAAPEIIVFLFSRMTAEAGFGNFFPVFIFEGNYVCFQRFFDVFFAGSVTRFAADDFAFPRRKIFEHSVFRAGDIIKLRFMTSRARFRPDVFVRIGRW